MRTSLLALTTVLLVVSLPPLWPLKGRPNLFGSTILRAITVTITSRNYATGQAMLCHGAVFAVAIIALVKFAFAEDGVAYSGP